MKQIKNIALAGHNGSGKTSLADALLFKAGAVDRLGKTIDGTTVCDFDSEEIKRKISITRRWHPLIMRKLKSILSTLPVFLILPEKWRRVYTPPTLL